MSKEELSRLVGDVLDDPAMLAEAMKITDQTTLEHYITSRGYDLTTGEISEAWTMSTVMLTESTHSFAPSSSSGKGSLKFS
ncbi:hypothetical protein [Pseudodesulfovibrio piezophilus]|uniref:Nif11 domain-containing protein n=1 Tax=Pseudodesulfovibrio piezophilus (strain DSM 21447 / JCM 15486 / C1TLV30) TaxID=1322246 RepID=M1WW45_PSEP2|nr:hypothetical protein [Pseudodesulfovibrio piezophilus]CCH48913.1 protein of unknown function [Pseudodesulfovibrio piezophilus C1TLV30]